MGMKKFFAAAGIICCLTAFTAMGVSADTWEDFEKEEEFELLRDMIGDTGREYDFGGGFTLYDIDDDGTMEAIVSTGTCDADWSFHVIAVVDGESKEIGTFGGSGRIFEPESWDDDGGIYYVYGNMLHEIVTRVTKDDDEIETEILRERDVMFADDYYENDDEIELTLFSDLEFE